MPSQDAEIYRLTEWIEPLLHQSLNQYLSSSKTDISLIQPSEQHFDIVKEVSNLCIRLATSQQLFLLQFHHSEGHVEAVLADSSSRIEAVFPREALKRWQIRARSQLTSFPSGTLFHIAESELRISNCFLAPRIVLKIHSFDIVGGLGNDIPCVIREIGGSSDLRHLLQLYAESCKRMRMSDEDAVTMSSPFRSQELDCSPYKHSDVVDDNENSEGNIVSQPFYTQIFQSPAPKHKRPPLVSRQPRVSQDTKPDQEMRFHDGPSFLQASKSAQPPVDSTEDVVDTVESNQEQVVFSLQSDDTFQKSAVPSGIVGHSAEMPRRLLVPTSLECDLWPGGRAPLSNRRYLPRHLTKIGKDQQEILEAPFAWQPSKADRKIRGSVPNHVLIDFTERADKAAENARNDEPCEWKQSPVVAKSIEDTHTHCGTENDASNVASDRSASVPWSLTPSRSAVPEPLLPDDSSPLQAPQRLLAPSLPQNDSCIASACPIISQEHHDQNRLGRPSQWQKTVSEVGQALEEALPLAHLRSPSVKNALCTLPSEEIRSSLSRRPSTELILSPKKEQGQSEDAKPSEAGSNLSESGRGLQRTGSVPIPTHGQKASCYREADPKGVLQVQRTPFIHHHARLIKTPELIGDQVNPPYTNTDEALPLDDQEPKSSTSVVPGTFMNRHADQHRQSELLSPKSLHDKLNSPEDELMEDEGGSEIVDISKFAGSVDAAPQAQSSSRNEELSGSEEHRSQLRPGKRKPYNEEHTIPRRRSRSRESQDSWSGQGLPKRSRTLSAFPALDALRDVSVAKAPPQIARESRRAWFRSRQTARKSSPPLSVPAVSIDEPRREDRFTGPLSTSCGASHLIQQRYITPRTSLLSVADSNAESGVNSISRLSLTKQNLYNAYKATYPEYEGDALQFHKACKQIKTMYREGKALHPSLWDDFIFRRHHDYRDYLLEVAESCEDALPYLQYYNEHIEKPSRMELVVKTSNILCLGTDSALRSSVQSPALRVQGHVDTVADLKTSVGVSSSASNILPAHATISPAAPSSHGSRRHKEYSLGSQKQDRSEQTQESSVKQWVELQSIEKVLGAESPELGSADVVTEVEDVPQEDLDDMRESPAPSSPGCPRPVEEEEPLWCDDPNTPFKSFARSFAALSSEKRHVKEPVKVDEKGCLEPRLQSVIDIFTLYRK